MNWTLVDDKTGAAVTLPAKRHDFRGDLATIKGGRPPQHEASTGRVYTSTNGEYFPSVFGLKWVQK